MPGGGWPMLSGGLALAFALGGDPALRDAGGKAAPGASGSPRWSVSVDGGLGSYGFYPGRPGPALGLDGQARVLRRRVFTLGLGPKIAYALTPSFLHALSLGAVVAPAFTGARGLTGETPLTLSYRQVWPDATTYRVGASGLRESRSRGAPGAALGIGAGLGYDALPARGLPVAALAGYEATLLAPFLPRNGVPVFMASTVWFKLRVHLFGIRGPAAGRARGRRGR